MDTILIEQLELETIVGVHAWEQRTPRRVLLDLELQLDTRPAAASDHLRDGLDYQAVCQAIADYVGPQRCQLIETLAESVARLLFQRFPIVGLRLKLSKPGAIGSARNVAVRIERRREDYAVCGR